VRARGSIIPVHQAVRNGTQTTLSFFLAILDPLPYRDFTWFFERPSDPPKNTTWHLKKWIFTGRLLRCKVTLVIIITCYIL